jgi:hypothetical protein
MQGIIFLTQERTILEWGVFADKIQYTLNSLVKDVALCIL